MIVIDCIGAGSARVEDFEIDTMKSFAAEMYRVIVVLTKADQATKTELTRLQAAIDKGLDFETKIIAVCAEEKELLSGPTKVFGLDELRTGVVNCFWTTLADRLPVRCVQLVQDRIDRWGREKHAWVERNQGVFGAQRNAAVLRDSAERFLSKLCGDEGPDSLNGIVQSETEGAMKQFFGFSDAYSGVAPKVVLSLRVKFPEISHGLRIGLGSLFAILSASVALAPLFLIIKRMSVNDLKRGVDDFASKMKQKVAKLEPSIRDEIRRCCEQVTQGNRVSEVDGARTSLATRFAGCAKSKVFHRLQCSALKKIAGGELAKFATRDEAVQAGRRPCGKCRP